MSRLADVLHRIEEALRAAEAVAARFTPGSVDWEQKGASGRWDPVTEADEALDDVLRRSLPRGDEGWLSEETRDDPARLDRRSVWVVDPLDGTREFVQGVPEWCVSVGFVEDGAPVAGGILNPARAELILGAVGEGVFLNGVEISPDRRDALAGAVVLASRSEHARGEWDRYAGSDFTVRPCGSVAYKLGLVAVGRADATWTLVPKHEWDVAAGAALVRAGGGRVLHADGSEPVFNRPDPRLPDFLAGERGLLADFRRRWLPIEDSPRGDESA